jgi:MFS family permease
VSGRGAEGRGAVALLRANAAFRRLWIARAISFVGDSLGLVALILYTASEVGDAVAVALLLLVGDCLPSLLSPFAGAVADRYGLRRTMVGCELVQGGSTLAIAILMPSLPALLALVAVRALAALVFQPASRAVVPALVDDGELERANATLGVGTNGLEVVGPLLAAALVALIDVRGLLLLDAATFAVSAALLMRLPRLDRTPDAERAGLAREAWTGLHATWSQPVVRALGLAFVAVVAANGVDDVALVFLARDELGGGDAAASLLYAGVGLGLLVGYAVLIRLGPRWPLAWLLVAGLALNSAGNLGTGLAWAVGAAFALQSIRGLGIAAMDVATNTLLQRHVPAPLLARTFANLYGAIGLAAGLSYLGGAALLELTDARVTLVAAGAAGLVVTLWAGLRLPRVVGRAAGDPPTST